MTDVEQDFTKITDEDLLKRMWQDTQDFGRKKEIRTHMYKLREARLRDLYDMDTTGANYGVSKTSSHGDLVADHSFASMKAKEVRDSESPTRDNRGGIIRPPTGEWNVISSTEKSADGKEAKHHTLATTGGVKNIAGGKKAYAGLEEETTHRRVDGDTSTEGHSSKTQLSEHSVTGNERDGKVERFSKSFQSSSSSVTRSGKTITNDFDSPDFAALKPRAVQKDIFDENMSLNRRDSQQSVSSSKHHHEQSTRRESSTHQEMRENVREEQQQRHERHQNQYSATSSTTKHDESHQNVQKSTKDENIRGEHLQTTRNPERVIEAFRLAEKPGQVVARTVVHTKPDTVCITETKVLTDGTKVTTKRYERVSTKSDIQTLRKQFNAIDASNTTTTTTKTDKRFTDEQNSQQKHLRQTSGTPKIPENRTSTTTVDHQMTSDHQNASIQKIQINQEESNTVTKSKIIKSDGTEVNIQTHPGTNVTRVERTEHRETLTQIPGELPPNQDIVIEERFVTHYDNKDNVRRDSYTKTEVTEKIVDEKFDERTTKKTSAPVVENTRISVEVDKTHQAWASSLRCVTPPPEGHHAQPNYQSPSAKRPSRRSPSRDSDVTKISNTTITKSTQYLPGKKTVTTEFRTHVQSPDRKPVVRGGRPQRYVTDSESEDQTTRISTTRKVSSDRSETHETSKFIRNETVTDNKTRKTKPVLKRTETYEDRCRLLIGMPEKPQSPTTPRQRSEDNLNSPIKPTKGVRPVIDDDSDTTRRSSFTKTTSDMTFDKKTLRTAQMTVDKNTKGTHKTEIKRTISPVDEDEVTTTKVTTKIEDTKKTKPADQKPSKFTTHETETVKITRTGDRPDNKRPATRRTVTDYASTTEDEEYSSTIKSRTEKRTSVEQPRGGKPVKPTDHTTTKVTETVVITQTTDDKRGKKPLQKGPKLVTETDEEEIVTTENEETIERRTSSYADDTISSTLKKTDTVFEYHPDAPSQDGPKKPQRTSDDFITNEKIHSTTSDSKTTRITESQPRDKSPYTGSKPSDSGRFTRYETETVKITRTTDDETTDQKVPSKKTPLKKGPKMETDTEEEVVTTENEETIERRTSSYTDDTISSTLKKVDATFDEFYAKERIHSSTNEVDAKPTDHPSFIPAQPRDKSPYTGSDKFTKFETETVKITRTSEDVDQKVPKKPVKKGPKLDTDTEEEVVTTENEETIERRTTSYADDTISSTLKKIDTTFEYHPTTKDETVDDFISKERTHSTTTSTTEVDFKPNNHPSYIPAQHQPRDKSPYTGSKTGTDKFTKFETETVKITRTTDEQPEKPAKKPVLKKGPKLETDTDEEEVTEETTHHRTSSYYDDTISSTLKKIDTSLDYIPTKDKPSDLQVKHDDFVSRERTHTENVAHQVVKKDKPKGMEPDQKRPSTHTTSTTTTTTVTSETEHEDYDRKISTTYLDDTFSSNLKKIHPDEFEDRRIRDKSPMPSTVDETKITKVVEEEKTIISSKPKPQGPQKTPKGPKTKKPDYDSDTDQDDVVVETYSVNTTTGTLSDNLKKVANKKVTEIKQTFESPSKKGESPKKPQEKPSTKYTKEVTEVKKVFETPKKPTEPQQKVVTTKKVVQNNKTSEFINNEVVNKQPATRVTPKKPADESSRFIKTEEKFTSANTVRHSAPVFTTKTEDYSSKTTRHSTPVVPTTPKKGPKEEKPRRGSIVEITIDVKEDTVAKNTDEKTPRKNRPSRTPDKKATTKTTSSTIKKEVIESDEQYSSSDNRRPAKKPVTEKRLSDDIHRRKIVTESITIKKDIVSDSDDMTTTTTTTRITPKNDTKSTVTTKKTTTITKDEEKTPTKSPKHQKKCITTKTINLTAKNLNTSDSLEENMIIDIQKAKSSREQSPNKLIPVPVSPDDEHVKTLPQRYPDKVVEPDDVKPKRKPVERNIPIFEEQTNDFVGIKIEEVADHLIDVKETSTNYTHTEVSSDDDVATLSVSKKVNLFINEAEKLKSPSPSRKMKFDRDVNFDLKREKFLTEKIIEEASESETEVTTTHRKKSETDRCFLNQRPKPVEREPSPSVSLKSTEVVQNITKKTTEKFETKDFDRSVPRQQSPGAPLKSTEAVKKAKAIFESPNPGTIPSKPRDIINRPSTFDTKPRTPVIEDEYEKKNITLVEAYEEKIVPRTAYKTYPERQNSRSSRIDDEIIPVRDSEELISASRPYSKTPEREPVKKNTTNERHYERKETQSYQSSSKSNTNKTSPRRPSNENTPRNSRYEDSPRKQTPSGGNPSPNNPNRRYSSEMPPYMKDGVSSKKDIFEKKITTTNTETFERRKSMSPAVEDLEKPLYNTKGHTNKVEYERSSSRELPSYMSPTVSSLVHSNRKFSIETQVKQVQNVVEEDEHVEGLVLKNKRPSYQRTPSKEVRRVSVTDAAIEDIFDLEILEHMLEVVVGYEQRRRIRAQIRLVKKLIAEGKVMTDGNVSTKLTTKTTTTTQRQSHERAPETHDFHTIESHHTVRNATPVTAKRTTTTTVEEYRSKNNEQPKLVKKETHTSTAGFGSSPKKSTQSQKSSKMTTKQEQVRTRTSTTRKDEFGVTPDFENGMPLFGLSALRKKDGPSYVQSKVTGTTVTEKRYSENGKAPIGERKVTHYSTDPRDLEKLVEKDSRTPSEIREKLFERQNSRSKGISSVTMVEKFGEDVEQDQRAILDNISEPSTVATNVSRVSRKSVDALKQKFSSCEQSSSVTETTMSHYPKAGLILRSSSRSSTPGASSFRSGSVDFDESDVEIRSLTRKTSRERISSSRQHISHDPFEDEEATTTVKRTTRVTSSGGNSFLDSSEKVTDIQDLLARMKSLDNAPRKPGETAEDQEARALLNRFLGASVLMSGAETILSDSGDSGIANQKVKSTKTSSSTRTFSSVHPTSGTKVLDTDKINDEETLRQLIESSKSYDERRILRAKLRQLMADKEVVNNNKMERQESVTSQKSETKELTEVIEKVASTEIADEPKKSSSTDDALNKVLGDAASDAAAGESRLLPLLQGILLSKSSPYYTSTETTGGDSGNVACNVDSSLCHNNSNSSCNNYGHEFLKIEDSGTESGEDFRLLAAGLKNGADGKGGAEILGEVNAALSRLQSSIKDGKEIDMDIDKRHSLLTLISKLRTELLGPAKPEVTPKLEQSSSCSSTQSVPAQKTFNRQDSNGSRFAKRRNRQNRHTVGVSREELADARRLVEAMIIRDALKTLPALEPEAPPQVVTVAPALYNLQKQKSAASITDKADKPTVLMRPSQFIQKNVAEDSHNTTAKPFGVPANNKIKMFRHCSYEQPHIAKDAEARRASVDVIDPENAPKVKFTNGFVKKTPDHVDSSSDEEGEERKPTNFNKSYHTVQSKVDAFTKNISREASVEKTKPLKHTESVKYATKKNRMRRSNTVDLSRHHDFDTDDEMSEHEDHSEACHSDSTPSGFRRGLIAPKVPQVRNIMPELKPKKESDEKFLALLKKQEQPKATPTWVSPIQKQQQQQNNWVNKFDNLKHAFEAGTKPAAAFPAPKSNNVAMKFWKCAEQNKSVDRSTILPPSGKVKPWQPPQPAPKVEAPRPPKPKFPVDALPKKELPQAEKFSHAPTSAFKPPAKKIQVPQEIFAPKTDEPKKIAPVSTGMVKQLAATGYKETPYVPPPKTMEPTKNVVSSLVRKNSLPKQKEAPLPCHIPWNGRKKDGAVDQAASKFEVNKYVPKLNPKYLPPDYEPPFPAVKQAPVLEAPLPKVQPPSVSAFKRGVSLPRQESLPLNVNNTYDPALDTLPRFNDQFNVDTVPNTPDENPNPVYTITDYTPNAVSTYEPSFTSRPTLNRSDSLTNPEAEPLVLTCTNQVYQPPQMRRNSGIYSKYNPMSMSTPSVSSGVMVTAEEMSDSASDTEDEDFSSSSGPVQEFKAVTKVMAAPVSGTAVTKIAKRTPERERKLTPNTTNTSTGSVGSVGSTGSNRSSMGSSPYDNVQHLQIPPPKLEVNSPTTPPMYEYQAPTFNNYQSKPVVSSGYNAPKPLTAFNNTQSVGYYQQPHIRQAPHQASFQSNNLQRAKSSHYLSVPEPSTQPSPPKPIMQEKQKQIAAYFGSGPNSAFKPLVKPNPPQNQTQTQPQVQFRQQQVPQQPQSILKRQSTAITMTTSINRAKTSAKRLSGLCRSQTMPNVKDVNLLDEGNVEDAFEQLINS
ncbi:titin homolog isoform X2 [Culicoides brevitarsis]|uniref:titin homolog isoform X2 n=1 Tax=Culicoides brevitarsis TaxID=469753 RepID=UPI00307B72FF